MANFILDAVASVVIICPSVLSTLAPLRNVEIAIIIIVPHTLSRGPHCQRSFCARGMNLFTAGRRLERGQVPQLLIVSDIEPPTIQPD
jgi:hypothetical protein